MSEIDFSNCKRYIRPFGGSDRKFGVIYNDEPYMLKFSEGHAKRTPTDLKKPQKTKKIIKI